jgi:hypothetical protein
MLITANNAWTEVLTDAEAAELFDVIRRGAVRALDVAIGEHGLQSPDYHTWRDMARDAAAVQANIRTARGWDE